MKILTLNWCYKKYSVGKIIKDIELSLSDHEDIKFIHCYEFGAHSDDSNAYRLSGKIEYKTYWTMAHLTGLQYAAGFLSNSRLRHIIDREKPDIVHVHCPNGFSVNLYELFRFLKTNNIATVITNHAEFYFTGNCAYAEECTKYMTGCSACMRWREATHSWLFNRTERAWRLMRESFDGFAFDRIQLVAVSPWAEKRIKDSTILGQLPCCTIYNGVNTDIFQPMKPFTGKENPTYSSFCDGSSSTDVFARYIAKNQDVPILLHVTSRFSDEETDVKGGIFILKLAKRLQDRGVNCRIIVAGTPALMNSYNELKNIVFLGEIQDQKSLAMLYSSAALLVMSSRRETFGMTCAESMCCGTPVVGFRNGGTESIALAQYSEFIPYGDLDGLESVIIKWLGRKSEFEGKLCLEATKIYGKKSMAENYYSLYKGMLHNEY